MKELISVSFSGGRTSAYMSFLMQTQMSDDFDLDFVFANTGKENEATLEFVDRCDKEWGLNLSWVEAIQMPRGISSSHCLVSFETASRKGEPFEAMIQKYGMPNPERSSCTRELKANAMRSYRLEKFGQRPHKIAIGIRADEFDRMNPNKIQLGIIYPLISKWHTTKKDVLGFWSKMPFDLNIEDYQGNCDLCFKKSDKKLIRILQQNPEKAEWWLEMEKNYSEMKIDTQPNRLEKNYFYRGNRSILDLLKIAKGGIQGDLFNTFGDFDFCGSGERCEEG